MIATAAVVASRDVRHAVAILVIAGAATLVMLVLALVTAAVADRRTAQRTLEIINGERWT